MAAACCRFRSCDLPALAPARRACALRRSTENGGQVIVVVVVVDMESGVGCGTRASARAERRTHTIGAPTLQPAVGWLLRPVAPHITSVPESPFV